MTGSVLVALSRLEIGRFEPANLLSMNREEVPQYELILSKPECHSRKPEGRRARQQLPFS